MDDLLVIHPGALGDVVAAFPVLSRVRRQHRAMDLLCAGSLTGLGGTGGLFRRAFSLDQARFSGLYARPAARELGEFFEPYGKVVLFAFSRDLESAVRHIFAGSVFRVDPRPAPGQRQWVPMFLAQQLSLAMMAPLIIDPSAGAGGAGRLKPESRILVHPGSGSLLKNWPLKRFVQTADILSDHGFYPDFIFGPADRPLMEAYQKDFSGAHPHASITQMTDLVERLEAAHGYMGNDSGVSHLAAWFKLFAVVIFGPSDPLRWRPYGPCVTVIRSGAMCCCCPCFENRHSACPDPVCLKEIHPDDVAAPFLRHIQAGPCR